jgi:hypothetical protein
MHEAFLINLCMGPVVALADFIQCLQSICPAQTAAELEQAAKVKTLAGKKVK